MLTRCVVYDNQQVARQAPATLPFGGHSDWLRCGETFDPKAFERGATYIVKPIAEDASVGLDDDSLVWHNIPMQSMPQSAARKQP
jgi:hypothetical protein